MAYTNVPSTDVSHWDDDYAALQAQIALETDGNTKRRQTIALQKLAVKIEKRLLADITIIERNHTVHDKNIAKFLAAAAAELKYAKSITASYKRNTRQTEYPPQIKHAVKKLADLEDAFKADNNAFGDAWKTYRQNPTPTIPEKHRNAFTARRLALINTDKPTAVKLRQVTAAKLEVEALLAIVDKATMKADIKRGGDQRPIADAQQAARDLTTQLTTLLHNLRVPVSLEPKPNSVESNKRMLVANAAKASYLQQPNALASARGTWTNADSAYKLIVAKAANMEKILATKTRGFRTNELSDAVVKGELIKAKQLVADAKAEYKNKTAFLAEAKKAMAKIESQAKKLKIK